MSDYVANGVAGAIPLNRKSQPSSGAVGQVFLKIFLISLLIFMLPLMIVVAVLIKLEDGGPVLFRHKRVGLGGRPFYCFKFRTMRVDAETYLAALLASDPRAREEWERDHKLRDDPRVTAVGQFLRKSSLDEVPQIINLLRGDMSVVGPRPIVEGEIAKYGWRYKHYNAVKPGLTGLWQVSGRSNVRYRRRVAMDVLYASRKSVGLDLWIIAKTIPAVMQSDGSY
ncbi:sugar transferase [Phenylobacterium sp.]|jgi:lipopolysaccharide/colanic/teichoic acid biosynthesis glycosyltransferase|uniref:sugar transferase n=1 Tax=Phenylobacterium sp. TaxID=1871053 RepID=UPI002F42C7A4